MFTPNVSKAAFRGTYMLHRVVEVDSKPYGQYERDDFNRGIVELKKANLVNPDTTIIVGGQECDSMYDQPEVFKQADEIAKKLSSPEAIDRINKVENIARGIKLAAVGMLVVAGLVHGHTAGEA